MFVDEGMQNFDRLFKLEKGSMRGIGRARTIEDK